MKTGRVERNCDRCSGLSAPSQGWRVEVAFSEKRLLNTFVSLSLVHP